MPQPFSYKLGQRVTLTATVIEDHDAGYPVLDLGGLPVMVSRLALDKADVRGDKDRLPTPEETDLERIKVAQDKRAVAQAEKEAAAERALVLEGTAMLDAAAKIADAAKKAAGSTVAQAKKPGG